MSRAPRQYIGTSGWSYAHWKGPFYPKGLADEAMLGFYLQRFQAVEINSSFYRLPAPAVLRAWHDAAPAGFRFAVKASRYITHMKKLKDCAAPLADLLARVSLLEDRIGPILFQLPPRWHFNAERLSAFLAMLSDEFRYTFEFRDHSWLNDEAYALLARRGTALCLYDLDGFLSPQILTTDFAYVRLHGPAGPYQGSYAKTALETWADRLAAWAAQGIEAHCYFDNDQGGAAAKNAQQLQALLKTRLSARQD
jgi:uncharacterized protein YecE (DUF72 family)